MTNSIKEKWKSGVLNDISEVVMGQSPPGNSYNIDRIGVGLINGPTEFTSKYPVVKQWTSKPTKLCNPGDILLCVRGSSTGRMNLSNGNYCIGRGVASVSAKYGKGITEYLYYLLEYKVSQLLKLTAGSTFPNLSSTDIRNMTINVPPLKEQQKIATILSTWDKAIELKEKLIEQEKEQKKGLMQKLLTGEVRLPGFIEDWQEKSLGLISKVTTGRSKSKYIEPNGRYLIVDMGAVSRGGLLISKKETNLDEDFLFNGDLVMVKDDIGGGNIIGKVVFIAENNKYILGDHVYKLEIVDEDALFISYLINSDIVNKDFRKKANGTAQLGLGRKDVEDQKLLLPPIAEQKSIANVLSNIDKEIYLMEKQVHYFKEQKKGLMQLLLTGKVRVKV